MARRRTDHRNLEAKMQETKVTLIRVERAEEECNMTPKEKASVKQTRRGILEYEGKQYYFVANRNTVPVVHGADNLEVVLELAKALDNKMVENKSKSRYYRENVKELYSRPNVYTEELDKGILIIKSGDKYIGYMPGKAGCRAVTYRKGGKPYSCAVKSLIKSLDKPGNRPFRTMQSQGEDIRNMIPHLMRIVEILDSRTDKPDPSNDGPGKNTKATQETNEATQNKPRRRRRQSTLENNNKDTREEVVNQKQPQQTKEIVNEKLSEKEKQSNAQYEEVYCGTCYCDTKQMIISESELQCTVCGDKWERFAEDNNIEETKEEQVIETKEEKQIITQEEETQATKDEEVKDTNDKEITATKDEIQKETNETSAPRRRRRRSNDENETQTTNDKTVEKTKANGQTECKRQGRGSRRAGRAAKNTGGDVSSVGASASGGAQVLGNGDGAHNTIERKRS